MPLQDEIDGPAVHKQAATKHRLAVRARHVVYLQLVAMIPTILIGQSEIWGNGDVWQTGIGEVVFAPFLWVLFLSPLLFPLAVYLRWATEPPDEKWSWVAVPLSVSLSFVQYLAFIPLVQ